MSRDLLCDISSTPDASEAQSGLLRELQVTMIRNPCVAHQLQLCVKASLYSDAMQDAISALRSMCLFFFVSLTPVRMRSVNYK